VLGLRVNELLVAEDVITSVEEHAADLVYQALFIGAVDSKYIFRHVLSAPPCISSSHLT
jgi:hypothetical protein